MTPPDPASRRELVDVSRVRIDVHLTPSARAAALRADVLAGLTAVPKELPPKWFYDQRGSALFEAITRLPEYYLTRREREILTERVGEIAERSAADTLVELGSGSSAKTRLLLDALAAAGRLRRFVPFDTSEATLRASAAAIAEEYRELEVHGLVADFECHLDRIPTRGRRLVALLGSTIGNLPPGERVRFLRDIGSTLRPGDSFLLGTDLVKDVRRLRAAYDDPQGVTAAFNRNVLWVLNRELGATFVPHRFEHVVRFDRENEWIEMRLRSTREQSVLLEGVGLTVEFAEAEEMRTEISAKFRRDRLEAELAAAGLELGEWWTDARGDFALSLSVPA
ncbi:MAG: L-histidine N(alpha)-methyltransferase [Actinomycetota bacterium]|nr:L-histidine N(alpha)-methyltransferase [Actinomycetota bacterium]